MSLIIKKNITFKIPRTFIYDPNFNPSSDPYAASVVFNNTFNSNVNAQNTSWSQGPNQEITTAPAGCPKPNCLHLSQGYADTSALYSEQGFGDLGMLDLTQSYTIEYWFYVTDINTDYGENGRFLFLRADGADPIYAAFGGDRSITLGWNSDGYNFYTSSPSLFNLNSWNHVAIVVDQSLTKSINYINGVNILQVTETISNFNGNPAHWEWGVGHDFDNGYDVYISNMRWTQAVRYTNNFTPTFVNFYNSAN
jgi:hypothetical protein